MSSQTVGRASMLVLLVIALSVFFVCAEGGREVANEKVRKEDPTTDSEKGSTASGVMVKTNDYGRYDPTPAFSKPRFKLIPN